MTIKLIATTEAERKPVLLIGLGRGSSGKSTGLAEVIYRAKNAGRSPLIGDADMRSRTLTEMFKAEATSPASDEPHDVKIWNTALLVQMIAEKRSAVIDFGGGDRILEEYGRELEVVAFCEENGIEPVAMYFLGPDEEDLKHALSIWRGGYFKPRRAIVVLNEGVVRSGQNKVAAFQRTILNAGLGEMRLAGTVIMNMPELTCMSQARTAPNGFYSAGSDGTIDLVRAHMVRKWLRDIEAERVRVGAAEWLP